MIPDTVDHTPFILQRTNCRMLSGPALKGLSTVADAANRQSPPPQFKRQRQSTLAGRGLSTRNTAFAVAIRQFAPVARIRNTRARPRLPQKTPATAMRPSGIMLLALLAVESFASVSYAQESNVVEVRANPS